MVKAIFPLEHVEQKRVFNTCKLLKLPNSNFTVYDFMFAIPNCGSRSKRRGLSLEAIRLKAEGVKSGILDIFLAYANPHLSLLKFDCKNGRKLLEEAGFNVEELLEVQKSA